MKPPALSIAFIGLGVMGYPMAGHLRKAGHTVAVYNRTPSKAQTWEKEFKGKAYDTPKQAAEQADIICMCVGNDDDVRSVVFGTTGVLAGLRPNAIVIDHTTASSQLAHELNDACTQAGGHFLDAPVSGGQSGAENGVLTIMCGGEPQVFAQVENILSAYARAVTLIGTTGSGQLAKMVNQICIAGIVQGLSEAIAFGEKAQLDMEKVLEVIAKGAAQSWQMENRGRNMLAGHFDYGFAVDWMRKDLSLVLEAGRKNGAQLPLTALVDQFYADVQQNGGNRWDTSSLVTRLR